MTRWQVLVQNMNPTLQPLDRALWARYIGEHVSTSIRRNSYCRVNGTDWWLSQVEVIEKLEPNNVKVEAYYLTNEQGEATDVWIYQNDMMIDKLQNVGTFNTADAEQTDEDVQIFTEQQKKIAHFGKYVKENAIARVGVMEKSSDGTAAYGEPKAEVAAVAQQHTEREEEMSSGGTAAYGEPAEPLPWQFKDETDAINDI